MLRTLVGRRAIARRPIFISSATTARPRRSRTGSNASRTPPGAILPSSASGTRQAGTPTVEANGEYDAATKTYALSLEAEPSADAGPARQEADAHSGAARAGRAIGAALPLTLEGENASGPDERVLELTEAEPALHLHRAWTKRRCFRSAGAFPRRRLQDAARRQARATLMKCDADDFNRWEQGQILARELLLDMRARPGARPTRTISTPSAKCWRARWTIRPSPPRC